MILTLLCSLALAQDARMGADPHMQDPLDEPTPLDLSVTEGEGIINGEAASEDDYPMAGGMLMSATIEIWGYVAPVDTFVCSSTLIAPDVVLLAAHCLDEASFTYGIGSLSDRLLWWTRQADLTTWDGSQQDPDLPEDAVEVVGWVIHEDFSIEDFGVGITQNDDIALLFLAEALEDAPRAYLPSAEEAAQVTEGAEVVVVGWGQQSATSFGQTPPAGSYAIKQQGASVLAEIGTHELQVGPEEADVRKCHGDSGGPTFLDVETDSAEKMRVIGVTSHAYDQTDCNTTGGVDTRVDAYLDWIDAQMIAACDDGTRVWCDVPGIITPDNDPNAVADGDPDTANNEETDGKAGCATLPAAPGLLALALALPAVLRRRSRTP